MESRSFKCEEERNDHIVHYEQMFGNVSETREIKCCGVLTKHRRKVKGKQVITLQMAQHLKTKKINSIPGDLFCARCKANFLIETEIHCLDDEDKVHSSTRTTNEFTECQTPRKKLQSVLISPVRLHAVMNTINRNISEA